MPQMPFAEVSRLADSVHICANKLGLSFAAIVDRLQPVLSRIASDPVEKGSRAMARSLLRARDRRAELIGFDIFRDPAWNILLDLYANGGEQNALTMSTVCQGAGVPITTALRYVYRLAELNAVTCTDHPTDHRCTIVRLALHMPERISRVLAIIDDGR